MESTKLLEEFALTLPVWIESEKIIAINAFSL